MVQAVEIVVPNIGDFADVEVIEILVGVGQAIRAEQSLVTVESAKASMEIPSPSAGVVREIRVKLGDRISEGAALLLLETAGEAEDARPASLPTAAPAAAPASGAAAIPQVAVPAGGDRPAGASASTLRAQVDAGTEEEIAVPDIGDFAEVEVIEVLVRPGDVVAAEQSLITVESDKASMEIPSPRAGTVTAVLVEVGAKVSKGSPIVRLRGATQGADRVASAAVAGPAPAPLVPGASAPDSASAPAAGSPRAPVEAQEAAPEHVVKPHASPSVRRLAREFGVDLAAVSGTGPKQRILHEDVRLYVKSALARIGEAPARAAPAGGAGDGLGLIAWPKIDFARFGPIESKPLSRIRKISGANLHRNWVVIPHVTNHDDADVTDLESFRLQLNREGEKSGTKVTMLAFLVKACVAALRRFPEFNASLDGESLVYKRYYHIGVAADTPNGLVVPVIRDADRKGVLEVAREMAELAGKAREGKLAPSDMQGGTFSISSLGGIGGTYFTPIINAPEVAILGVCKAAMRPVWNGEQFAPRLMLPLSLSWDHRVIDGAAAARFNAYLGQLLADFRRTML